MGNDVIERVVEQNGYALAGEKAGASEKVPKSAGRSAELAVGTPLSFEPDRRLIWRGRGRCRNKRSETSMGGSVRSWRAMERLLSAIADFHIIALGQGLGALESSSQTGREELGGNDSGEGHVIRLAKGLSLIDLRHELCNRAGMKETGFAQRLLRQATLGRRPLRAH